MNVTGVSSPVTPGGDPVPNAYTLQLNTNYFRAASLCDLALRPGCKGWQQFVYANNPRAAAGEPIGVVYVEYWLIGYNAPGHPELDTCPAGWTDYHYPDDTVHLLCRHQNRSAMPVPDKPMTTSSLAGYRLTGINSSTGPDVAIFQDTADPNIYAATGSNVIDPGVDWQQAEFNVFGYGHGFEATFASGADFHVRTTINYGGTAAPKCVDGGFSAETNNLNFVLPRPPKSGTDPAVLFHEATHAPPGGVIASSGCAAAVVIGDTHEYTFAGLWYDFQATGDFTEALVGTDFEVQTRKLSGAPTWPNASVNRSVATRMGSSTVALCDGTRLFVNGSLTDLAPGGSLLLPAGVTIKRVNNVYVVQDPSGNSIRVAVNSGYVDLGVILGIWPTTVRGLLGNPNNDPNRLEARDGTQFTVPPIPFPDIYSRFGNSWRVNPFTSLLQPCSTVPPSNPSAPFYAGDVKRINPTLDTLAAMECRAAGVTHPALLDACRLDVSVIGLGRNAAAVYTRMPPPVISGNPAQPPPCSPGSGSPGCSGGGGHLPQ